MEVVALAMASVLIILNGIVVTTILFLASIFGEAAWLLFAAQIWMAVFTGGLAVSLVLLGIVCIQEQVGIVWAIFLFVMAAACLGAGIACNISLVGA